MSPQVANTPTALTLNSFTRLGYTFSGWNTLANGTGTAYADGASYSFSADATLYAQWSINSYIVTYNGNTNTGGTAPVDGSSPYTYGSTVTVLGNTGSLVKTGYSFNGWNTQADGLGTSYSPAATFTLGAANVTLYAKWNACYALTLNHTGQGTDPVASPTNSIGCTTGQYNAGETINVSGAVPNPGWQISSWTGTNNNTSTASSNSITMPSSVRTATVIYTQEQYTLTITSAHGIVGKSPDKATYVYDDVVQLTATASVGYTFANWSDGLTGSTNPDSITIHGNTTVTANYVLGTNVLTVSKTGTGSGSVTSDPTGIDCGVTCAANFDIGAAVSLTATPATGSTFTGWSGACTGTGACDVTMSASKAVTASFTLNTYTLTVSKTGLGSGTVSSVPAGIYCGASCSANFDYNTAVILTATPAIDSTFTSWSGACTGTGTCNITMSAARTVTANFTLHAPTFSDVPYDYSATLGGVVYPLHDYIEALYDAGYTAGCATDPLRYCPNQTMTRAESAVFMLRGQNGSGYIPPIAPWDTFADNWSPGTWAEKWAEGMLQEGMTAGCQFPANTLPKLFCPWDLFPRVQAAVFGLRMMHGKDYIPPAATGTLFADMTDPGYYGTKWAEQAYLDGLLVACGTQGGKPLFCPNTLLTRAWAAYMVVVAKNLPLGP
jgi:uncharacterized repeat protein (TIGR02543 family)